MTAGSLSNDPTPTNLLGDLDAIARLIRDGHTEAAERLATLAARLAALEQRNRAVEFELNWLLKHAREKPVRLVYDDRDDFAEAHRVPHGGPAGGYVLAGCARLDSLLAGEIPSEGRA